LGSCRAPYEPYNPRPATTAVYHTDRVWADPLSLATTQGMISFPGGTKMFQFPPCPPSGLWIQPAVPGYCPGGFPHSGIPGSKLDDSSPRLIAAIHALLRLLAPRHPPYALSSLIHARRQSLIRLTYDRATLRSPDRCDLPIAAFHSVVKASIPVPEALPPGPRSLRSPAVDWPSSVGR
jgi:hypothetical protein